MSRELPKSLNCLGIALCLRQPRSGISSAAFKCKPLRNSLIQRVCLLINKECRMLEKKSLLKKTAVSDLKHFKWNSVLKEWKKEAPTFYRIIKTIAAPPTISRNRMKKHLLKPIIGSAGAILLEGRNPRLSAVQHLVGLSLFLGRARKKVKLLLLNAVYMSCFYNYYIIIVIVLEKGRKVNGNSKGEGGFKSPIF